MPSTGYIDASGVYHKAKAVPLSKIVKTRQTLFQQGDWARQRFDHAAEIVQPYTVDGKPNPKFIEAFPEDAAQHGFIPKEQVDDGPKSYDTPNPNEEGFGGSIPWDYQVRQRIQEQ